MSKKNAEEKSGRYSFFSHRDCEFFPCHAGADPENFNCLFCYCPLYALGRDCGGNFRYLEGGVKDCTNCLFPHERENYAAIVARFAEIREIVRQNDEKSGAKQK